MRRRSILGPSEGEGLPCSTGLLDTTIERETYALLDNDRFKKNGCYRVVFSTFLSVSSSKPLGNTTESTQVSYVATATRTTMKLGAGFLRIFFSSVISLFPTCRHDCNPGSS
jgi:hypothetical protein